MKKITQLACIMDGWVQKIRKTTYEQSIRVLCLLSAKKVIIGCEVHKTHIHLNYFLTLKMFKISFIDHETSYLALGTPEKMSCLAKEVPSGCVAKC